VPLLTSRSDFVVGLTMSKIVTPRRTLDAVVSLLTNFPSVTVAAGSLRAGRGPTSRPAGSIW
jgi:hypothetical protein